MKQPEIAEESDQRPLEWFSSRGWYWQEIHSRVSAGSRAMTVIGGMSADPLLYPRQGHNHVAMAPVPGYGSTA
ncbi:MAG: hypothetical protein R6V19_11585 [Armatimonadota bacterium]